MNSKPEREHELSDLPKRLLWLAGLLGVMGALSLAVLKFDFDSRGATGSGEVLLGHYSDER